jgi:hypothetical protein
MNMNEDHPSLGTELTTSLQNPDNHIKIVIQSDQSHGITFESCVYLKTTFISTKFKESANLSVSHLRGD